MTPRLNLLALLAIAGLALSACGKGGGAPEGAMSLGNPEAPVKVVEYASATCHVCADFNEKVFPDFKKKYIDTGKVHYSLQEVLTPPNDVAAAGFLLARCAGPDKYFSVLDTIFRNQQALFNGPPRDTLLRIAQSTGMTEAQFQACVSDEKALKALNDRVDSGLKAHKIEGTPTFIINGKNIGAGVLPLTKFDEEIAAASK